MDLNLWKSKDEMKKYLDNLGTEYRYGCFEEKNPETCHLLGDYLLSIEKAFTKAAKVYKSNCEEGKFGLSCDAYARMTFRGQGMAAPDPKMALEYFIRGCNLNEPRSCYHGGQMLGVMDKSINNVILPQPKVALEMLKKACLSQKEPAACTLVHSFYLKGFHDHPADLKASADYALIACDQNEYASCTNLSRMYKLGDGVTADAQKAEYYKQRALDIIKSFRQKLDTDTNATSDI